MRVKGDITARYEMLVNMYKSVTTVIASPTARGRFLDGLL